MIDNSSEIWGYCKADECERIQYRAIRYFLGVHKFCPIPALTGDMGWPSCRERRFKAMIRFWNRLVKLSDDRLTKKVFLWDLEQKESGNWSSEIESIMDMCNMLGTFENKTIFPLDTISKNLNSITEEAWVEKCNALPKLRSYRKYKTSYKTEPYVKMFLSKFERSLIAQLRSGILPLKLETGRFRNVKDAVTGRYRKLKIEERRCEFMQKWS